MDLEYVLAFLYVGHRDDHLPVETAGPEQCRVEDVRPVGGREDYDAVLGIEAVHLDEHLVEGLFPFVMAAAVAGSAGSPDRVQLVDEKDAGGALAALLEEVAYAARADADEHLHEIGT